MNRIVMSKIGCLRTGFLPCTRNGLSSMISPKLGYRKFSYSRVRFNEQKKQGEANSELMGNVLKIGLPVVVVVGIMYVVLKGERDGAKKSAFVKETFDRYATSGNDKSTPNHVKIGNFFFNQTDVEAAYKASPEKFINDVVNVSKRLDIIDESKYDSQYRALCLFARSILLVDSACTSDILKKAKESFSLATKVETN